MTRVNGAYLNAKQAWEKLGIYGGDDGFTPDQDRRAAEKAARIMGQVMTVEFGYLSSDVCTTVRRAFTTKPDVGPVTSGQKGYA